MTGQERMKNGVGATDQTVVNATRKGSFADPMPGEKSQGETAGAGSIFAATLAQRPNLSNPRNAGPERPVSATGAGSIPVQTMASRHTGKKS